MDYVRRCASRIAVVGNHDDQVSTDVNEAMAQESVRQAALTRLRTTIAEGLAIIGGGAGSGLSAKSQEAGGIDLLILYNSGKFRMAGLGSLAGLMPYGDANAIMLEMAREVLNVVGNDTPVLAGICGTDPFRNMRRLLQEVKDLGFVGVENFPTVGLIGNKTIVNHFKKLLNGVFVSP